MIPPDASLSSEHRLLFCPSHATRQTGAQHALANDYGFQTWASLKAYVEAQYEGTALQWALYGSGNGWHRETGDFVGTVQALRQAGAVVPRGPKALEPREDGLELLRP